MNIKRGDIYYADLSPVVGSEQGGIRPKTKLPTHIPIEAKGCGLAKDSIVLLEQVRTLDKRRLKEKMGSVDYNSMKEINRALSVSFGLIG